ncbi:TonB-dependent receptor [Sungkyunkwania multivorans]|uniref:TonB-dependent receptor n=1 Tax=Sungkyunkwania multivorans TaxID=1173618 RepID=A0ABW3D1R4_9FLAO
MKTLFTFLSFVALSFTTIAQTYTLSGVVTDQDGRPFPGVSVVVEGTTTGTTTDFEGVYTLRLSKGNYILSFHYLAPKAHLEEVEVNSDTTLNVQLGSNMTILDEVLVSAVRVDADSPVSHSNLSEEEIAERNLGQDIPILMNYLPSVVTTSDAGAGIGYTGIRVRGSDATRVNVTINGIPYNDAESQGTFWVNLPDFASSVESLQLQRGVGTSTNGAGAFGASLNLLTDAVSEEANGEISNAIGSFQTRKHTVKFSTGRINDHFEIAGRLSSIQSDGYIDRASADLKSYFLQASYVDEKTLVKALVFGGKERTYQSWFGIPRSLLETDRTYNPAGEQYDENGNLLGFYEDQVDNYNQDHYQFHINRIFDEHWSARLGLNYTWGRGFFEEYIDEYASREFNFAPDATFDFLGLDPVVVNGQTITETDNVRRLWLDNDYYVGTFSVNYRKDNTEAIFGGLYSEYDGDHFGELIWARYASNSEPFDRLYYNKAIKKEYSLFAKANFDLDDRWRLFGDLQIRGVDYKVDGTVKGSETFTVDDEHFFFNPKAGVTFNVNDNNNLYFSYARASREPNRSDYENGNPKPEFLNDFELGWRFNKENVRLNTNLYYMRYKDQLVLTGELDDVGAPIRSNVGDSYRLGLELDAMWAITDKWVWSPNATFSVNKNLDYVESRDGVLRDFGNTDISFSPRVIAGNMIAFKPISGFQISLLSKFVGEQFLSNNELEVAKLESYFVNDINIQYEIETNTIFKSIVFTGLFNNILNEQYVSNGYYFNFDDDFSQPGVVTTVDGTGYYPQAGTNFLLGATLKF